MMHKEKEIEEFRQRLVEIQKEERPNKRIEDLQALAKEVGASTHGLSMWSDSDRAGVSEGNLVANIHNALQTATMIVMCEIAFRNYIIALLAVIIALGSAVALWIAVCK
jgi:3-dehydroquinate dehydratase